MKKLFTLIAASLMALSAFAVATTNNAYAVSDSASKSNEAINVTTNAEGKVLHPFKDYSHWSISVNGGLSQFDGDAKQNYNQILSSSYIMWTAGIDVEYTFNPAWGLILNFQYNPYQGYTSTTDYGNNYFRGNMYNINLMGSLNPLNLFAQYRKSWHWAWYINGGVGVSFYDAKSWVGNKDGQLRNELKDARCMSFPLGTQVEYNINKWLAVGINAYYAFHNKDNFEAEHYVKGTLNDGEFYATLNLRVKFCEKDREGGHMRNITMYSFNKACSGENKDFQADLDSLKRRVKALEDTVSNNILPRIASLEQQHATTPDEDGDGVPDFRDREPNTPLGSYVNYWGESLPEDVTAIKGCCDEVKKIAEQINLGVDYDLSVYFPFDKYYLTKVAQENVAKAAQKLNEDPELKVELRGYCDFPGNAAYNLNLSNNRVNTVEGELIKKYGIDPARISKTGKGKLPNPPQKEYKNRRCDFYFYK